MLIANVLGIIIFLYLYWKRLREDYSNEKIFNAGFILIGCISLSFFISKILIPNYWFWIIFVIILISQVLTVSKLKLRMFESLDALVISLLSWLSLFYLGDSITHSSLSSFLIFWSSLICIFLFFLFDNFYRTFSWYKSGKVGFSGLATLGIFFLIRLLTSILFTNIISFAPNYESVFSGTIFVLTFLLLFNLARIKK